MSLLHTLSLCAEWNEIPLFYICMIYFYSFVLLGSVLIKIQGGRRMRMDLGEFHDYPKDNRNRQR